MVDTHIWIWWAQGDRERLGDCMDLLDTLPDAEVGVSVISLWETALLVKRNRLELKLSFGEWLNVACARPQVRILPLLPETAIASAQLPGELHRDPADRFLIAEARAHNCLIVTEDREILKYDGVRGIRCNQLADALAG